MTANDSNRIDFIDFAKGLCILLVVYFHAAAFVSVSSGMDAMLGSFRMPLYFFLSGLFFKPYEGFRGFLIRKTNKLLIPFAFFYLTTSVILPYIFWKFLGHTINTVVGIESLWAFINLETFPNVPIWFLWCLFLLNLFFYGLYLLSSKTRHPLRMLSLLCLGAGLIGFSCLFFHVNLYAFIDEALEAMPFFCCGYLLRQYSIQAPAGIFNILKSNPERKGRYMTESIIGIALLAAYTYLMTSFQTENYFLRLWIRYSCGIGGTLMVIFIARLHACAANPNRGHALREIPPGLCGQPLGHHAVGHAALLAAHPADEARHPLVHRSKRPDKAAAEPLSHAASPARKPEEKKTSPHIEARRG